MNLPDLIRKYELGPPRWVAEDGILVERIISGEPMSADKRKTLLYGGEHGHDPSLVVTGTNAFLDFRTIGVLEYPSDSAAQFIATVRSAIQVLRIGVEPHCLHQGYGLALVEYLAAVAKGRQIFGLVCTGNPELFPHLRTFEQLGFVQGQRYIRPDVTVTLPHQERQSDFFKLYAPLPLQIPDHP